MTIDCHAHMSKIIDECCWTIDFLNEPAFGQLITRLWESFHYQLTLSKEKQKPAHPIVF